MDNFVKYAEHIGANDRVINWINSTLVNYYQKQNPTTKEVEHILDYLVSSDAPARIGRMSYDEAKSNAEKWNKKLIKQGENIEELEGDTEVVLDFKDGFKFVKLVGENSYKREGHLMRHCVAEYYGKDVNIYSLRDKNNKPHCTIEENHQIKGKGNGDIHPKYIDYVVEFLEHLGMDVSDKEMLNLGYISVETFKSNLSNETKSKLFRNTYLPKQEKLIDKEGYEFSTFDLLDQMPLIVETRTGVKLNFELPQFIELSVNFLLKKVSKNKKISNSAKIGSSGYSAQIGSSDSYAKIGSSGYSTQIGSSGDFAQIGSSGNYARVGFSGYSAQIGSSGNSAKIGSSGNSAKIGCSGDYVQIGSSGNYTQIGSSGDFAQIGCSGDYAQIGSSGKYVQIGSSGNSAKIGCSGDYAQIGSSGKYVQIGSSGNSAKIGSSSDFAKIDSTGNDAVVAAIGEKAQAKASKGSWITLAEYDANDKPICVRSIQVDGKTIKADTWYTLRSGKFVEAK